MAIQRFEYNLDYYSGAQAAVFFEDVLIDEVTSLQWTVQQNKVPIYGYASQTFDEMAKGTIIVQGSFSINFVEAGYLWATLDRLRQRGQTQREDPNTTAMRAGWQTDMQAQHIMKWMDDNIDGFRKVGLSDYNQQEVMNNWFEWFKDTDSNPHKQDIVSYINDYIWGPTPGLGETRINDNDLTDQRRTDRKELNGFDIYLSFSHDSAYTGTVHKIQEVHLTGKAQTVVIDENPIQEVYSFYAKNVI